jgi:hypothetical protein
MFTWLDNLLAFRHDPIGSLFLRRGRRSKRQRQCKPRSLRAEPLEQRQLLSALPVGVDDSYLVREGTAIVLAGTAGVVANDRLDLAATNFRFDLKDKFLLVPKSAGDDGGQTKDAIRSLVFRGLGDDGPGSRTDASVSAFAPMREAAVWEEGLFSSTAAAANARAADAGPLTVIACADAADLGLEPGDTYYGQTIPSTGCIIIRTTYEGDINLDGQVNDADRTLADGTDASWAAGDFDGDGTATTSLDEGHLLGAGLLTASTVPPLHDPTPTHLLTGPVNFSRCCRFGSCAFDSGLMLGVGCVTA